MLLHPWFTADAEERHLRFCLVPWIERDLRRPRQVGRSDVHPAIRRVHASHVHPVARGARSLRGIAQAHRVEVHRVLDPEGAEHEDVVAARDRLACSVARVFCLAAGAGQRCPLAAQRKNVARRVVAEHSGVARRKIARSQRRRPIGLDQVARAGACHLRDVHLAFELDDARDLSGAERACHLQVILRGVVSLNGQCRYTRIGHQVHACGLASERIGRGRHAVLADEGTDAKVLVRRVLRVRHRARTAEHGNRRVRALKAVDRIGVAAGGIADDFDRELRIDARPIGTPGWPGKRHPDQSALEQQ